MTYLPEDPTNSRIAQAIDRERARGDISMDYVFFGMLALLAMGFLVFAFVPVKREKS